MPPREQCRLTLRGVKRDGECSKSERLRETSITQKALAGTTGDAMRCDNGRKGENTHIPGFTANPMNE